jgi:hypothetical protein
MGYRGILGHDLGHARTSVLETGSPSFRQRARGRVPLRFPLPISLVCETAVQQASPARLPCRAAGRAACAWLSAYAGERAIHARRISFTLQRMGPDGAPVGGDPIIKGHTTTLASRMRF